MNMSTAIQRFVATKHVAGIAYRKPERLLMHFCLYVRDVDLGQVTTQDVAGYLNPAIARPQTWQRKYHLLRRLFEYWAVRGQMPPLLMPFKRARVRSTFTPYIYNHAEIVRLLESTSKSQTNSLCALEARTFRMLLFLMYALGLKLEEVVCLKRQDLNLRRRFVTIVNQRYRRERRLPISAELCAILRDYVEWRFRMNTADRHLFVKRSGTPVGSKEICNYFKRLIRVSGLRRSDGMAGWPRMIDLRTTFAVNRITSWLEDGSNLNQLLPALAAYLGQFGLGSTERYVRLSPERFRKQVQCLSPQKGRKHWRDDERLMRFLQTI